MTNNKTDNTTASQSIALLVDFDAIRNPENFNKITRCARPQFWPEVATDMLEQRLKGTITTKRFYGNPSAAFPSDWDSAVQDTEKLRSIQHSEASLKALIEADFTRNDAARNTGSEKPALAELVIDALEIAQRESEIKTIVIATDSQSLGVLSRQIQETGKKVVILVIGPQPKDSSALPSTNEEATRIAYDQALINTFGYSNYRGLIPQVAAKQNKQKNRTPIAQLDTELSRVLPRFAPGKLGYANFEEFVRENIPAGYKLNNGSLVAPPSTEPANAQAPNITAKKKTGPVKASVPTVPQTTTPVPAIQQTPRKPTIREPLPGSHQNNKPPMKNMNGTIIRNANKQTGQRKRPYQTNHAGTPRTPRHPARPYRPQNAREQYTRQGNVRPRPAESVQQETWGQQVTKQICKLIVMFLPIPGLTKQRILNQI